MWDNKKETALTRVKRRGSWQVSRDTSIYKDTVNQFTVFLFWAATFFAGVWALACLINVLSQDGPLSTLSQLATAISGH